MADVVTSASVPLHGALCALLEWLMQWRLKESTEDRHMEPLEVMQM